MKHDWDIIKTEYITTDISTRKLAEKHHTTQAEISKRCSKEHWVILRSEHRDKVMSKAVRKVAESKADVLCNEIRALDYLSDAILASVSDPQQFQRYIISKSTVEGGKSAIEMIFEKYDTKALKDVASALEIVIRIKLELAGILSEKDQILTNIANQKLEIEKLKFELEQKKAESPESKEIRVIMSEELLQWSK